jgi:hypothetical protein
LNEFPKYAVFAFVSLISIDGVPLATILQLDITIATSTHERRSLA